MNFEWFESLIFRTELDYDLSSVICGIEIKSYVLFSIKIQWTIQLMYQHLCIQFIGMYPDGTTFKRIFVKSKMGRDRIWLASYTI